MGGRLRISVLGPVRAWSAGRPIPLGSPRQRTVFAVLVAAANRIVTPTELIAAVWGSSPPTAARDNLYTYVSGLRRGLGAEVLESRPAGYLLRLDAGARDSDRFATTVAEAVARQDAGDDAGAAARLGDALRLWGGTPYASLDGDLFEVERAYLERLRLDAIERRARLLVSSGDDGLVAELSGLVRENPLHEPLYELLMRALHRAGRPAEALAVFRTAHGVLVAELGVEPGAGLRELQRQILDGPPEPDSPAWAELPGGAPELLRLAVLLGPEFHADALIAATGRRPLEVLADLDEVLAAGILHETGAGMAFRDPQVAASVYDSISAPGRLELRRRVTEALAALGRPAVEVAAQLTAEPAAADRWLLSWTVAHLAELADQAPRAAARLSRLLLDSSLPTDRQRETLLVAYARSDFRAGGRPVAEARAALRRVADPAHQAEMRQILATLQTGDGATAMLTSALADNRTPSVWRTRHRVLLTQVGRAGEPYDAISALQNEWRTNSIGRDHGAALGYADRALDLLGSRTPYADLHLDLLDNRIFSLQNLDRLDEAEQSLHEATLVGIRHRLAAPLPVASAVQHFWAGRWTEAVAQLSAVTDDAAEVGLLGRREQRTGVLLRHGVAALIAVHRGDALRAYPGAEAHLGVEAHLGMEAWTEAERENADFLLVARALFAAQPHRLDLLAPLLDPGYAPMVLRHQWLPDLLRSARQDGRPEIAERAAALCATEAAKERTPARAAAALARCQALMSGDPEPALGAAEYYRSVGRVPERAAALEDAAVLLAARGHAADAAQRADEAGGLYRGLGASWDRRRLRSRLAARA